MKPAERLLFSSGRPTSRLVDRGAPWLRAASGLALLSLVLVAGGCGSDEERIAEFLDRGESYVESGDDAEAIIEYKNVLQLDPENPEAHEALSLAYLRVGKPREAYWEMSEAVRVDPTNVEARLRYGTISAAIGDFDLSNEQAEEVLRLDSNNARGFTLRAQARENRSDPEGAEADFRSAVAAEENAAAFRFLLGGFLERHDQADEAERVYRSLLEIEPSYLVAYTLTRLMLRQDAADEEVDAQLAQLIELANAAPVEAPDADADSESQGTTTLVYNVLRDEAITGAYTLKALVQRSRGDVEGAVSTLEEGIERSEGKTQLIYQLAQFYRADGRIEDEQRMIRRATEEAPESANAQLVLSAYLGTQGDLEGALTAAQAAVEADPESVPAQLRVSELLIDMGYAEDDAEKIERGRVIVDEVLSATPDAPEANFVKAKIALAENDVDTAKEALETTLQARPDWGQARFVLGSALAATGELTRARAELEAALEDEPALLDARRLLVQVYQSLGEHEFVIENGRTFLQSRPDDMPVRIAVGQSLIRVGRTQEAYDEIAQVPESEWDAAAFFALGRIDLAYGRIDEGARKLARADALAPGNAQVIRELVKIDRSRGKNEAAVARVVAASEATPENSSLVELLGEVLLVTGDPDGGRKALARAVELEPRNVSAQIKLADLARRTGDLDVGVTILERAVEAVPESVDLQYKLAEAYGAVGRTDESLRAYERTLALNPGAALAKNNLAYLLAQNGGDLDRALELAQEAKEALPDDGNAADTLGWVLLQRGLPSAAIGYLQEAAELVDAEAFEVQGVVHNHLAQAYEANEDPAKALEASRASVEFFDRLAKVAAELGAEVAPPEWVGEAKARIARLESAG